MAKGKAQGRTSFRILPTIVQQPARSEVYTATLSICGAFSATIDDQFRVQYNAHHDRRAELVLQHVWASYSTVLRRYYFSAVPILRRCRPHIVGARAGQNTIQYSTICIQ